MTLTSTEIAQQFETAKELFEAGQRSRSEKILLKLVELENPHPRWWFYLGMARDGSGRCAEAILPYQNALALAEQNQGDATLTQTEVLACMTYLTSSLLRAHRVNEAMAEFDRLMALYPSVIKLCDNNLRNHLIWLIESNLPRRFRRKKQ